jgi:hypothetical protein
VLGFPHWSSSGQLEVSILEAALDEVDWFAIIAAVTVIALIAAFRMSRRKPEILVHPDTPLGHTDWAAIRALRDDEGYGLAVDHLRRSLSRANDPYVAPRRLLQVMDEHQTDLIGAILILTEGTKLQTREEQDAFVAAERMRMEEARQRGGAANKLEARRRARAERKAEIKSKRGE